MENVRVHLFVSGRVQGVCFRMETKACANRIGVSGWVRNLPDRHVEVVAEGTRDQVEALISWCRKGPPAAEVHHLEIAWEGYRGEFSAFSIHY